MKKKQVIWSMLTLMTAAVFSLGFVSCGDDDDDGDNGNSSIVGTWRWYYDDYDDGEVYHGYEEFTFYKDGTGLYRDEDDDGSEVIRYSFDAKAKQLIIYFGDEREEFYVEQITSSKLILVYYYYDYGERMAERMVFNRQ